MFKRLLIAGLALASQTLGTPMNMEPRQETTIGPETGHLVIVGGNLKNTTIWEKIIELAGGKDAPFVVIPTAGGEETYNQSAPTAELLRGLGVTDVTVVHTYDPAEADTEEFVQPILKAKGLFFDGGRQWRLVDAYAGTRTEVAFQSILSRGGVISGSSAGASIQASFLARGDTATNQIMVGDHTVGFGYLKNAAVDQHFIVRNRHFDLLEITRTRPELLGLAVNEDTAMVVQGNRLEVLGATYVAVYDRKFWSREGWELKTLPPPEERFYFIREGDVYDLAKREVVEATGIIPPGQG